MSHGTLQSPVEAAGTPEETQHADDRAGAATAGQAVDDDGGHLADGIESVHEACHELFTQMAIFDQDAQETHEQQECRHHREEGEVGQCRSQHAAAAAVVGAHDLRDPADQRKS